MYSRNRNHKHLFHQGLIHCTRILQINQRLVEVFLLQWQGQLIDNKLVKLTQTTNLHKNFCFVFV